MAARRGTSVTRMLAERLEELVRREKTTWPRSGGPWHIWKRATSSAGRRPPRGTRCMIGKAFIDTRILLYARSGVRREARGCEGVGEADVAWV